MSPRDLLGQVARVATRSLRGGPDVTRLLPRRATGRTLDESYDPDTPRDPASSDDLESRPDRRDRGKRTGLRRAGRVAQADCPRRE